MKTTSGFVTLALALIASADRTFTVKNSCTFTIWPAIFTDPNVGTSKPSQATGWEAAPGSSVTFTAPDDWKSGRIWGRQECSFTNGQGSCVTGSCVGGLLCTLPGDTPATLAEFTLGGGAGGQDFYDVSNVDGFNLPIAVTPTGGCHEASCPVNLNAICPSQLQGPFDPAGNVLGCKTACTAGLAPDPNNSPNCCTGSHGTAPTCPPSTVQFYSFFKGNCPDAYAYAFDESSGTALFLCDSGLSPDYAIEFCPNSSGSAPASPPPPPPSSPSSSGKAIHFNGNTSKCLDVQGGVFANGTPVQLFDCNGSQAQQWVINSGSTKVQVVGTNFCLDAGSSPANGTGMKIWQCLDNLPAQEWSYTSDNHISLENQGFCLDLTNGSLTNGNIVQIWQCTSGNANQIWTQ